MEGMVAEEDMPVHLKDQWVVCINIAQCTLVTLTSASLKDLMEACTLTYPTLTLIVASVAVVVAIEEVAVDVTEVLIIS